MRHSDVVFYFLCATPRQVNCAWKWSCRRALGIAGGLRALRVLHEESGYRKLASNGRVPT